MTISSNKTNFNLTFYINSYSQETDEKKTTSKKASENKPGTSRSFSSDQHQNVSSNLFSVLKYWMSKRVDSFDLERKSSSNNRKSSSKNESSGSTESMLLDAKTESTAKESKQSLKGWKPKYAHLKKKTSNPNNNPNDQNSSSLIKFKRRSTRSSFMDSISASHQLTLINKLNNLLVETINLRNLQHLSLRNLGNSVIKRPILNSLLKNMTGLKYLDISNVCAGNLYYYKTKSHMNKKNCLEDEEMSVVAATNGKELVGGLDSLLKLAPSLTHLILADLSVQDVEANLPYLLTLKKLKLLDISNCREKTPLNSFKNPSLLLAKLVYHLTSLNSLDISGKFMSL